LNCISVNAPLPVFLTLTFPDAVFNDSVTDFAKDAKAWLDVWLKRLRRVAPDACGFWRLEWQSRKSGKYEGKLVPHFHLMIWGLPSRPAGMRIIKDQAVEVWEPVVNFKDRQVQFDFMGTLMTACSASEGTGREARGHYESLVRIHDAKWDDKHVAWFSAVHDGGTVRYLAGYSTHKMKDFLLSKVEQENDERLDQNQMLFADWASLSWYHVVGSHDLAHFTAGVRVEPVRSWGGVMTYCSKYIAKLDDNNFLSQVPVGRQWGIFQRALIPWAKMVTLELPDDVGVRLRRIARRYLERVSGRKRIFPYGVTLYCTPERLSSMWAKPPDVPF
jgi:hypothetical protein